MKTTFVIDESYSGQRLDAALADIDTTYSRASWKKLILRGDVLVDGKVKKANYTVKGREVINITKPVGEDVEVSVPIIYEDKNVVVINKPPGLLVHASGSLHQEPTVVDLLKEKLTNFPDSNRPGVVHRLDRDTSGVMVLAKNKDTLSYIQKQFKNRSVKKKYNAVVMGVLKEDRALIDVPIGRSSKKPSEFTPSKKGKPAQTEVHMVAYDENKDTSLAELHPLTGRTHQLRVHLKYIGHPIIGDKIYGKEKGVESRLMLHARTISLAIAHDDYRTFEAPLPEGFML